MQINKLHIQSHEVGAPQSQRLDTSRGRKSGDGAVDTRQNDVGFERTSVETYLKDLRSFPEIRTEHVEAARHRLARGEYTTHRAAVETAAALLNRS